MLQKSLITKLAIAVMATSAMATAFTSSAAYAQTTSSSQMQLLPDFTKLVEDNGAGVVNISAIRNARQVKVQNPFPIDPQQAEILRQFGFPLPGMGNGGTEVIPEQRGTGSGFIISSDGLIMTNAHVVDGADRIKVRLTDKREFDGKVLGVDKKTDIAIVKIDAKNLPAVKIGDSDKLKVGEWVAAIGSPFGLDNTVTAGIVSALSRNLPSDTYVPFIQTDVAVNPGNSGGPLFNMKGEVVGINSQIFSTSGGFMGLSFSIPIDLAMQIKDQLVANGKVVRGYIGVNIQELNQDLADSFKLKTPQGALVTKVTKDGPAAKAGLKTGDVITKVDDKVIQNSIQLPAIISSTKVGTPVTLTIIRNSQEMKLPVTVAALKDDSATTKSQTPQAEKQLGAKVRPLTKEEAKRAETTGLLITNVSGIAATIGLRPGDILVSADKKPLTSVEDLQKACQKDKVTLLVQRKDGRFFVPIVFKDYDIKK